MSVPTQPAKLIDVREPASSIREMVIDPRHRLRYKPGQWVSLHLPVGPNPPLIRAYSMAEPEDDSGRLVLCLDRVSRGLGSNYLFGLEPGAEITLAGPFGNFVTPSPLEADLVLAARHTGIVPVRCMVKDLLARGDGRRIDLAYGTQHRAEMVYHEDLADLSRRHQRFRYHPTILAADEPFGDDHRPELDILREVVGKLATPTYLPMICGLKAFVYPIREFFMQLGFERRAVRCETYD